jgi:hypothetical protein
MLSLLVALGGTAVAATGGSFLLGKANSAGTTTTLSNTGKGAALTLRTARKTTPPLSVSGNKTKIASLNADYVDGLTSSQFQRRVTGSCSDPTTSITAVLANGAVSCGNSTAALQHRVAGTCSGASSVQAVGADGSVTCVDATTGLQKRVTGACSGASSVQTVGADGTVGCVDATAGLQKRVTGTCTGASSVQTVGADGTVSCVDATAGLQKRVTGTCTGTQAMQTVAPDGTVTCTADQMWAAVNSDGTKARGRSVTSVSNPSGGQFVVTFDRDVSQCAYVATIGAATVSTPPFAWINASPAASNPDGVAVMTAAAGSPQIPANEPFILQVVC